jgi:hypothetical protein
MIQRRFDRTMGKKNTTRQPRGIVGMYGKTLPASGIITAEDYRQYYTPFATEEEFQQTIRNLAETLSWVANFTYRSVNSAAGEPDLRMYSLQRGRFVLAELKTDIGELSPGQVHQIRMLAEMPNVEVYVWRYQDWIDGRPQDILKARSRPYEQPVATDPRDLHALWPERYAAPPKPPRGASGRPSKLRAAAKPKPAAARKKKSV